MKQRVEDPVYLLVKFITQEIKHLTLYNGKNEPCRSEIPRPWFDSWDMTLAD